MSDPNDLIGESWLRRRSMRTELRPRAIRLEAPGRGGAPQAIPVQVADCGETSGAWVQRPSFSIRDARLTGIVTPPMGIYIEIYFELDLRIEGRLRCTDCGQTRSDTQVQFDVMLPIMYQMPIIKLFFPRYLRLLLLLRDALRAGVSVVNFFIDNRELMEFLTHAVGPMLDLVRNSANLICAGVFDRSQLQDYIRRRLLEESMRGRQWA